MRMARSHRWRLAGTVAGGTVLAVVLAQHGAAAAAVALPENVVVAASGPTDFSFGTLQPRWTAFVLHPDQATLSVSVQGPGGSVALSSVSAAKLGQAFVAIDTRTVATGTYTAAVKTLTGTAGYRVEYDPGRFELTRDLHSTELSLKAGYVSVWQVWMEAGEVFEVGRKGNTAVLGAMVAPAAASRVPVPPHTTPPSTPPGWVPGMVPGTSALRPTTPTGCPYLSRWEPARVSGWYGLVLRNTATTSQPLRLQRSTEPGNPCAVP